MEMPQPNEHHEKLRRFAGTWKGVETMVPSQWDPQGGDAEAHTVGRTALAGLSVLVDYEQRRPEGPSFEGHGVYCWDARAEEVVLYWFDSMGMGVDTFRGKWDGDTIQMRSQNPMGHWRITETFQGETARTARMETSNDGESWTTMFDGRYERTAPE